MIFREGIQMSGILVMPISDLRTKGQDTLKKVQRQPAVITQRGRPQAVLVSYEQYNDMINRLETLEAARDALIIERALQTAKDFATFEEMLADYAETTGIQFTLNEIAEAAKDV